MLLRAAGPRGLCRWATCWAPATAQAAELYRKHYEQHRRGVLGHARRRARPRTCVEPGCELPLKGDGMCRSNYERRVRIANGALTRAATEYPPSRPTVCGRDGCPRRIHARCVCSTHYVSD